MGRSVRAREKIQRVWVTINLFNDVIATVIVIVNDITRERCRENHSVINEQKKREREREKERERGN
jgi:hypothetical protein